MAERHDVRSSFLRRIVDMGASPDLDSSDLRHLRVTNIAALIGMAFMGLWTLISFVNGDTIPIINNIFAILIFMLVLVFNRMGRAVLASSWFMLIAYQQLALSFYLYGFDSGVGLVCITVILFPYMIFPRKARKLAHGFAVTGCVAWVLVTAGQKYLPSHLYVFDPLLQQVINTTFVALACLAIVVSFLRVAERAEDALKAEREKSDELLHNILPVSIARELKEMGKTEPKLHEHVTILFSDFKGFTELVASISAIELVNELNDIFGHFDDIVAEEGLEKIETIGDAYLAVCGLPEETPDHAVKCVRAAQRMQQYISERNLRHTLQWNMRVGLHSGPVVAGVVGKKKFAYDLFGDSVNTASRMETAGEPGKINISGTTYEQVKHAFPCEHRGKIYAKGKGELDMYFVG